MDLGPLMALQMMSMDMVWRVQGGAGGHALLADDLEALLPAHVGGDLEHVVAVPAGVGDEGDGGRILTHARAEDHVARLATAVDLRRLRVRRKARASRATLGPYPRRMPCTKYVS